LDKQQESGPSKNRFSGGRRERLFWRLKCEVVEGNPGWKRKIAKKWMKTPPGSDRWWEWASDRTGLKSRHEGKKM